MSIIDEQVTHLDEVVTPYPAGPFYGKPRDQWWSEGVAKGNLTARTDGPDRYDVTDDQAAIFFYRCTGRTPWCVMQTGHPGACCDVKETSVTGTRPTPYYATREAHEAFWGGAA